MKSNHNNLGWELRQYFVKVKNKSATFFPSFLLIAVMILFLAVTSPAATLSLSWEPNTEPDLAGYKIYYDKNQSGSFQNVVDVGNVVEYTLAGLESGETYRVALTAYDFSNNESDFSAETDVMIPLPAFKMETGSVVLKDEWVRVTYSQPFSDPIVVANCLSFDNGDPATIRIRNIDEYGFEIRAQKWEYLEQTSTSESVNYLVVERGRHILSDGSCLEAGSFDTNDTDSFGTIDFTQPFNQLPVIITSVSTDNEADAVIGRIDAISLSSFDFRLQEQELNEPEHETETITFIAWEPSQGTVDGITYTIGTEPNVTDQFSTIDFDPAYRDAPVFLADLQTANDTDPANLRYRNKGEFSVEVKISEEQSKDSETEHMPEDMGFMIFGVAGDPSDGGTPSGGGGTPSGGGSSSGGGAPSGGGVSSGGGGISGGATPPINLSHSELHIESSAVVRVSITGGTPPYNAVSSSDEIATATVVGSVINIEGINDGTSSITITDAANHTATLTITVHIAGNPSSPMPQVSSSEPPVDPALTPIFVSEGVISVLPRMKMPHGNNVAVPLMFLWLPDAGMGFDLSRFVASDYHDNVLTFYLGTIDFTGFPGTYDIYYGYIDVDGKIHYNAYELRVHP